MHPRGATPYELIETFAGINFARGCGNAVSREVRNVDGTGIAILMHLPNGMRLLRMDIHW